MVFKQLMSIFILLNLASCSGRPSQDQQKAMTENSIAPINFDKKLTIQDILKNNGIKETEFTLYPFISTGSTNQGLMIMQDQTIVKGVVGGTAPPVCSMKTKEVLNLIKANYYAINDKDQKTFSKKIREKDFPHYSFIMYFVIGGEKLYFNSNHIIIKDKIYYSSNWENYFKLDDIYETCIEQQLDARNLNIDKSKPLTTEQVFLENKLDLPFEGTALMTMLTHPETACMINAETLGSFLNGPLYKEKQTPNSIHTKKITTYFVWDNTVIYYDVDMIKIKDNIYHFETIKKDYDRAFYCLKN